MNKTTWSLGIAGCLYLETVSGAEATNTIPEVSLYGADTLLINQIVPSTTLLDRWIQEIVPTGSRITYERYSTPSSFIWINYYDTQMYSIHEYSSEYGKKTIFKILGAAARESASETLPLMDYADTWSRWSGQVWTTFFKGSIGNPEEEDSPLVSATPSYNSLRHIVHFEWNNPKDTWGGEYGWRPWRDNPYVYLNNNYGHYHGRQFIRTEIRCYGYLRPNSFGIVKTEANAIITLSQKSHLVIGGFAYPFENKERYQPQGSVRIETYWRESLISFGVVSTSTGPWWNMTASFRF